MTLDEPAEGETIKYGQRGERVIGQYRAPFPHYAVTLDEPLDDRVRDAWVRLAKENLVASAKLEETVTRGEFIRKAWEAR